MFHRFVILIVRFIYERIYNYNYDGARKTRKKARIIFLGHGKRREKSLRLYRVLQEVMKPAFFRGKGLFFLPTGLSPVYILHS